MFHWEVTVPLHKQGADTPGETGPCGYKEHALLQISFSFGSTYLSYSLLFPDVVSSDSVSFIDPWLWNCFVFFLLL